MTLQEAIDGWETMEPRERDVAVAQHVLRWAELPIGICPTTDIRYAMEVEEKIVALVGKRAYVYTLVGLVCEHNPPDCADDFYALAHAAPHARCKAALMALREKKP